MTENGLAQEWYGRVWLNPPFVQLSPGQSSIKPFVIKAVRDYEAGNIEAAILLLPNDTSTTWFNALRKYIICFASKRVEFNIPGKKPAHPSFGTIFAYLGPDEAIFASIFSKFGIVMKAVNASKSDDAIQASLWDKEVVA
jgi:hypothetical protein